MSVWWKSKSFDVNKSLDVISTSPFDIKMCPDAWKNGNRWVRNQKNKVDLEKSYITSLYAYVVSS